MKDQKQSQSVTLALRHSFSPLLAISGVQDRRQVVPDDFFGLSHGYEALLKSLMSVPLFDGSITRFKQRKQLEVKAKQQIIFQQEEKALKQQTIDQRQHKHTGTDQRGEIDGGGVHGVVYRNEKQGYWLDGGADDVTVADVPFGDSITNGLLKNPSSIILKDILANEEITSHEFLRKMNVISSFLNTWEGVKRGDTVLFFIKNSINTMLFFTACFKSGVVAANAGFLSSPDHPKTMVEMCGASIIFTDSSLLQQVRYVKSLLDQPIKIIVEDGKHEDCISLEDILNNTNNNNNDNTNNNDNINNTNNSNTNNINNNSTNSNNDLYNVNNLNNTQHILSNENKNHHENHNSNNINNNNNDSHNSIYNNNNDNNNTHNSNNNNYINNFDNNVSKNISDAVTRDIKDAVTRDINDAVTRDINVDDTALIIFSSGTTGFAKAIQLSHRNLNYQLAVSLGKNVRKIQPGQVVFAPFNHLSGSIIPLFGIATSSLTNLLSKFDVDQYLQLLKENKLQFVFTVPRILNQIAKNADLKAFNPQNSSIKEFICGTAPLAPEIATQLCRKMPGVSLRGSYGLTEISGMCTVMPGRSNDDGAKSPNSLHASGRSESVGIPLPSVQIKIMDINNHSTLSPHQNGEVLLKGPMIMKGYLDRRAESKPANPVDQDGWLHTGDLGYFDDSGHLYIVDRIKDIITCRGHQISPLELESLLMRHDNVIDAGVFSVAGTGLSSLAAAWVVLREGAGVSEAELVDFVAANAPPFKRLEGGLDIVDKIPRSASGKIIRWEMEKK